MPWRTAIAGARLQPSYNRGVKIGSETSQCEANHEQSPAKGLDQIYPIGCCQIQTHSIDILGLG
jgi:hypothetical protein